MAVQTTHTEARSSTAEHCSPSENKKQYTELEMASQQKIIVLEYILSENIGQSANNKRSLLQQTLARLTAHRETDQPINRQTDRESDKVRVLLASPLRFQSRASKRTDKQQRSD